MTEPRPGFFARLKSGLSRSANSLAAIFTKRRLDAQTLDEIEELLIGADLGAPAAKRLRESVARGRYDKEIGESELKELLAGSLAEILAPCAKPFVPGDATPHVMLVVGVNGSGKTTTIGKLARLFREQGHKVMLAAGDTFRAAAIEQLQIWGERTGSPVIAKPQGSDAAGLAFEALEQAKAEGAGLLIIDTAGRLQNKNDLMAELAKIVRVLKKLDATAPHSVLLVLDATTGQNALSQVEMFQKIAGVTGLAMTKLDGTARGGILVAIAERFRLPIHFVGVGEGETDLQPFDAVSFSRALVGADAGQ